MIVYALKKYQFELKEQGRPVHVPILTSFHESCQNTF